MNQEDNSDIQPSDRITLRISKKLFEENGRMSLAKNDPAVDLGHSFCAFIDCKFAEMGEDAFCADGVYAERVIVEENALMKFWGRVWWLAVPKSHTVNISGYDPLYAEFRIGSDDCVVVEKLLVCDYDDEFDLNKFYYFDIEMNWIFELC